MCDSCYSLLSPHTDLARNLPASLHPGKCPSHLCSGSFSCASSHKKPDYQRSMVGGVTLLRDLSFSHRSSPFPCRLPFPWKSGIILRSRKLFKNLYSIPGFLRELQLKSKGAVTQNCMGILLLRTLLLAFHMDPVRGMLLHLHNVLQ